jgi:hypothetical protein
MKTDRRLRFTVPLALALQAAYQRFTGIARRPRNLFDGRPR